MAPRAYWKGWLKVAAISCPVRLYAATTSANRISFHEINRDTGHRINLRPHESVTGDELSRDQLVKGYEFEKGQYLLVDDDELDELHVTPTKTIEIEQFVPLAKLDRIYLEKPYYLAPDGAVAEQSYAVIREAMARNGTAALGHVVLSRNERAVALSPRDKGMLLSTLRPPIDMRAEADLFSEIGRGKLDPEMVDLAGLIMDRRAGHFDPETFEDSWQVALRGVVEAKIKGEKPKAPAARKPAKVIDLKDALKRALEAEGGGKAAPARGGKPHRGAASPRRRAG
ncbi:MAG: ykoV [Rhodospirillales bacterium]|nr:ykoV [Rhodospirillales bacterium]